jgi:hypothetical protein
MAMAGAASAQQWARLAWDQSQDSSVAGYHVYYQAANSTNVAQLDVGNAVEAVVTGLTAGQTYTFTVTSYNTGGVESAPSDAVVYVVPAPIQLSGLSNPTGSQVLHFQVSPGHSYQVQASTDLTSWTTIWQSTNTTAYAWIDFQDPQSAAFPSRFYRLQQQ